MIYDIIEYLLGGAITGIFIVIIIAILIYIFMMVWVYKDANQRNMESALYVVLVFFFGCCGLMIYYLARADHPIGGQTGPYGSQGPRIDTTHRAQPQYGQTQSRQTQSRQPQYGQPKYGQTQAPPSPQPQKVSHKSKFCRYCGGKMPNDARFCSICGANEFNN